MCAHFFFLRLIIDLCSRTAEQKQHQSPADTDNTANVWMEGMSQMSGAGVAQ